jgi:hypothetical protein
MSNISKCPAYQDLAALIPSFSTLAPVDMSLQPRHIYPVTLIQLLDYPKSVLYQDVVCLISFPATLIPLETKIPPSL